MNSTIIKCLPILGSETEMDCLADNPGELSQSVSGDAIFVKNYKKLLFHY